VYLIEHFHILLSDDDAAIDLINNEIIAGRIPDNNEIIVAHREDGRLIARLEVKIGDDSLSTESYVRAVPKPLQIKNKKTNPIKKNIPKSALQKLRKLILLL
jgi:hypothetical protein